MDRHIHEPLYKVGMIIGGYVTFDGTAKDVNTVFKALIEPGIGNSKVRVKGGDGKTFDIIPNVTLMRTALELSPSN